MVIDFTEDRYEYLKEVARTGKYENNKFNKELADYLGCIKQGAVCCDLTILEDEGFEGENFCFGGKFVIDAKYFLLGKDTGYGRKKGVPYDCVMGFYGRLKDTYEETVKGLSEMFSECLKEDDGLVEGIKETELTWDKVDSYSGDIYPGFEKLA